MRGRTLNDAFVILDEAQNTTPEQMKMFLTRIGFGSKAVITGDVSQIDLPRGHEPGWSTPSACWRTCGASRSRISRRPTWCAIRWSRASSRPTTRARMRERRDARGRARRTASAAARRRLTLSLQFAEHRVVPRGTAAARNASRAGCAPRSPRPAEITVRIVDADEGRTLNREYRGKDYATNVLTFAYATEPTVVADLVLCAPVVEREAAEQGIGLAAHYAHLIVHGALHAQGFDHEADADAKKMEGRESRIVTGLGFADPYAR